MRKLFRYSFLLLSAFAVFGFLSCNNNPENGNEKNQTVKPSVTLQIVNKTSEMQSSVNFTLTAIPAAGTVFRVYEDNIVTKQHSTVAADWLSGTTLTLKSFGLINDVPAITYYVSAAEPGKTESERLPLIVGEYEPPSHYNPAELGNMRFEDGTTSGWIDWSNNFGAGAVVLTDAAGSHSGGNYIKLPAGRSDAWMTILKPLKDFLHYHGAGFYRFGCWARVDSSSNVR
jgi:hypothetical protein